VRLCQSSEDTVYLAMRYGDEAVYLDRREGSYPIKTLTVAAGDRRPLGVGAAPLAMLAFLPDAEMEHIIALQTEARARLGVDELLLREMIGISRQLGYALNESKIIPDMTAVAVPIRGGDGTPLAAISVACLSRRMQGARREAIVASLREEVARIESDLKPLLAPGSVGQGSRIVARR
jgi:DNA-binding IclR family transcriptional regulator